jgi:hypothetical protein
MLWYGQASSVNPSPNANAKSELGFKKGHETLQVGTTVGLFSVKYNDILIFALINREWIRFERIPGTSPWLITLHKL